MEIIPFNFETNKIRTYTDENATAIETNKILEARGFQVRENNIWHLTEKGKSFGIEFQNGNFLQIKWKLESII